MPSTSLPPQASGRVSHAVREIYTSAANPDLAKTGAGVPPHERDLVTRLINDPKNKPYWERLLNNNFCKAMKEADKHDIFVLMGFEWYMKQDYHYVASLIQFESDRFTKAVNTSDFETMIKRVSETTGYTGHFFKMCTTPQPNGLGILPPVLLETKLCDVLKEYIKLTNSMAELEDEVFSMVVMIVSIQSYASLAAELYKYSLHEDTLWYKFWAEDNYTIVTAALTQQRFFIDNYDGWKDRYDEAALIFRETCDLELGLWDEALKHSNPNA